MYHTRPPREPLPNGWRRPGSPSCFQNHVTVTLRMQATANPSNRPGTRRGQAGPSSAPGRRLMVPGRGSRHHEPGVHPTSLKQFSGISSLDPHDHPTWGQSGPTLHMEKAQRGLITPRFAALKLQTPQLRPSSPALCALRALVPEDAQRLAYTRLRAAAPRPGAPRCRVQGWAQGARGGDRAHGQGGTPEAAAQAGEKSGVGGLAFPDRDSPRGLRGPGRGLLLTPRGWRPWPAPECNRCPPGGSPAAPARAAKTSTAARGRPPGQVWTLPGAETLDKTICHYSHFSV